MLQFDQAKVNFIMQVKTRTKDPNKGPRYEEPVEVGGRRVTPKKVTCRMCIFWRKFPNRHELRKFLCKRYGKTRAEMLLIDDDEYYKQPEVAEVSSQLRPLYQIGVLDLPDKPKKVKRVDSYIPGWCRQRHCVTGCSDKCRDRGQRSE